MERLAARMARGSLCQEAATEGESQVNQKPNDHELDIAIIALIMFVGLGVILALLNRRPRKGCWTRLNSESQH